MIVGRFMASAVICRIIVAYELAGMTAAEGTRVKGQQKANVGDLEKGNNATREQSEDPALDRNTFGTGSGISQAQTIKYQALVRSKSYSPTF
jgi:hypothetical protein